MNPFGDIFGDFFGGHGGHQRREEQVGPSARIKIKLSLEDIYNGREMPITYYKMAICPHCRGSGADDPEDVHVCEHCGGSG